MKIKTKKQLNLPQLIEWAWYNDVWGETFLIDSNQEAGIHFDGYCDFRMHNADFIRNNDTFTGEVEEEITEDTEFKELICLDVDDTYNSYDNVSVLDLDDDRVRAIYIPNNDLTMTLIWSDGKLVE
ncbi:hypothetical protein [Staphylococcus equorum]|uniref:hypothetical protein n=1 Tax=Staphylococcus equorum TaxID=246432 RepID=UPI00192D1732|nr:hypothetical protein [Staphylococcus equorum]